ncbi:hypothetical protein GCM10022262_05920 [Georgenia daeguensis]|uniref:Uncharacterized protein n=1 Tax=Georgenia daeguensis TaxID=908355 RepID=A0ABP8EQF1_9MICO
MTSVPRSTAEIDRSSVQTFRRDARALYVDHSVGSTVLKLFLTHALCAAGLLLVGLGLAAAADGVEGWPWVLLAGLALAGLTLWRSVRAFRRAAAVRREVAALAADFERGAADGAVPWAPRDWQQGALPPLHEDLVRG